MISQILAAATPKNSCVTPFDTVTYAGWVSGLSAVVGAILVATIVLRLGNPPVEESLARLAPVKNEHRDRVLEDLARPLLTMPVAFIAALLAAFLYAIVSGTANPRATELEFFAGGELIIAALLLAFSITWLLRDYDVHGHAVMNSALLMVVITSIGMLFMNVAVSDARGIRSECMSSRATVSTALAAGVLPLLAVLYRLFVLTFRAGAGQVRLRRVSGVQALMGFAMVLVIAFSFGAGVFVQADDGNPVPLGVMLAYLTALSGFAAGLVLLLPFKGGRERMPDVEPRSTETPRAPEAAPQAPS